MDEISGGLNATRLDLAKQTTRRPRSSSARAREASELERIEHFQRLADHKLGASYRLARVILGERAEAEDAVHDDLEATEPPAGFSGALAYRGNADSAVDGTSYSQYVATDMSDPRLDGDFVLSVRG